MKKEQNSAGRDALKSLGKISKAEADYYKKQIKVEDLKWIYLLFDIARRYFVDKMGGLVSFAGEVEVLESCAHYYFNQNKDKFLDDTEFIFNFNKKDINKIIKEYKKELKELKDYF